MAITRLNNNSVSSITSLSAVTSVPNLASLPSGLVANTPTFHAHKNTGQTIANGTDTLVEFQGTKFDTDSAFSTSTYRFTPQVAGKYFLYASLRWDTGTDFDISYLSIARNGVNQLTGGAGNRYYNFVPVCGTLTANGTTDYFTVKIQHNFGSNLGTQGGDYGNYFGGFLILE